MLSKLMRFMVVNINTKTGRHIVCVKMPLILHWAITSLCKKHFIRNYTHPTSFWVKPLWSIYRMPVPTSMIQWQRKVSLFDEKWSESRNPTERGWRVHTHCRQHWGCYLSTLWRGVKCGWRGEGSWTDKLQTGGAEVWSHSNYTNKRMT